MTLPRCCLSSLFLESRRRMKVTKSCTRQDFLYFSLCIHLFFPYTQSPQPEILNRIVGINIYKSPPPPTPPHRALGIQIKTGNCVSPPCFRLKWPHWGKYQHRHSHSYSSLCFLLSRHILWSCSLCYPSFFSVLFCSRVGIIFGKIFNAHFRFC